MTANNLVIQNLTFAYNAKNSFLFSQSAAKNVFDNMSISFEAGKPTAVMAPSGSGKTTLLFLITGLLKMQSGSITYPVANPRFSMVFQEDRLLEQETILNNLKLVNSTLDTEAALELLERAGLSNQGSKKICRLSGGEKRRVAIIRALWAEYDILLLDEPFTGLDETTKLRMIDFIKEKTIGKTVILVTHNKSDADALGCKIVSLT